MFLNASRFVCVCQNTYKMFGLWHYNVPVTWMWRVANMQKQRNLFFFVRNCAKLRMLWCLHWFSRAIGCRFLAKIASKAKMFEPHSPGCNSIYCMQRSCTDYNKPSACHKVHKSLWNQLNRRRTSAGGRHSWRCKGNKRKHNETFISFW